jgi:phage tail-like protein
MDANGTHFHLLLGKDDWGACLSAEHESLALLWAAEAGAASVEWDAERHQLHLRREETLFPAARQDRAPRLDQRRGAARDRYLNWYWISDERTSIEVLSAGSGVVSRFWTAGDGAACGLPQGDFAPVTSPVPVIPVDLQGLTITDDHFLIVGTLQPAGLAVFDLHASGPPTLLRWPEGVPFVPFDLTPRTGGGLWILDRDHARVWGLDGSLRLLWRSSFTPGADEPDFQPAGSTIADAPSAVETACVLGTTPRGAGEVDAFIAAATLPVSAGALAIERFTDDTFVILANGEGGATVQRYGFGLPPEAQGFVTDDGRGPLQLAFRAHDLAFVPHFRAVDGSTADRLFVVSASGNQAHEFFVTGDDDRVQPGVAFYPLRLFGGKGLVAAGGQVFYDLGQRWLPIVEQIHAQRYLTAAVLYTPFAPGGGGNGASSLAPPTAAVRPAFDGREPGCVWHRLMLDACLPPETAVDIWSRAADTEHGLANAAWQPERLYRRGTGSELPFAPQSPDPHAGTWELLFQRARGRYLQVRLMLRGNGRSTPRLRALRLYYPRFSYLEHYLPAVYRDDPDSASFLDRFLANMEGMFTTLEDRIAAAQLLFDIRSAPPDALDWLASWLGLLLEPGWDDYRRRLLVKHAMLLFHRRGTLRGLQMALRLALDDDVDDATLLDPERCDRIRIVEHFRLRRPPPARAAGTDEPRLPRVTPVAPRWQPEDGAAALHRRYQEFWQELADAFTTFLNRQTGPDRERWREAHARVQALARAIEAYPIVPPGAPETDDWRLFSEHVLGFTPTIASGDRERFRDFLARRYEHIGGLNAAWSLTGSDRLGAFDAVTLPERLPEVQAALRDWYEFQTRVLPGHYAAHRFSVLLPVRDAREVARNVERRRIAERVTELEKPAHTVFDVKHYWALFRAGGARLGIDTVVDRLGSRAPELMRPLVIGDGYLAEAYLAPHHPLDVTDRLLVGRDRLP